MDHSELLKSMLQDIINNKEENASVTMHDYFVSKTREVSGLGQPMVQQAASSYDDNENDDVDYDNNVSDNEDDE